VNAIDKVQCTQTLNRSGWRLGPMVGNPVITHCANIDTAALGAAARQRCRTDGDRYDDRELTHRMPTPWTDPLVRLDRTTSSCVHADA
jgi:hypothetical protein